MKKILLGAAALSFLFATSCKKSDDNNGSSNSFTVDGKTYNPSVVTYATTGGASMGAADMSGASVGVYFNGTSVPAAGTYDVVTAPTAASQISFLVSKTLGSVYISHTASSQKANVSVSNGKVTVKATDIWVYDQAGTDSIKISTNLTQTN